MPSPWSTSIGSFLITTALNDDSMDDYKQGLEAPQSPSIVSVTEIMQKNLPRKLPEVPIKHPSSYTTPLRGRIADLRPVNANSHMSAFSGRYELFLREGGEVTRKIDIPRVKPSGRIRHFKGYTPSSRNPAR